VYNSQISNNVGIQNTSHRGLNFNKTTLAPKTTLSGEGFVDIIKSVYEKGSALKRGAEMLSDAYSSELGTAFRNALPSSDASARPGYAGEKHTILKLSNGKYGVANYMGPNTNLLERLRKGDPPRTECDRASQAHDIRYALAMNTNDVRRADNIMMTKVREIERNRGDAPQNIAQAKLIRAKMITEDMGLIRKDAFSGELSNKTIPDKDRMTLMSKLGPLSQEGYGLSQAGTALLPGDALKIKILKDLMKKKNKLKGSGSSSASRDLGKSYKLLGNGYMAGAGIEDITNFVVNKIIPELMRMVGISKDVLPVEQLVSIIKKSLEMAKSGNLVTVIAHLAKTILPILIHGKLRSTRGGGKKKLMKGKGLMDFLGKHKDMLLQTLSKGLLEAFKIYLNHHSKQAGSGVIFTGSGKKKLKGAGFWDDFKKGFLSVFKPGAKILGTIATAVGVPEIGIPLKILGDVL
jgi:hypothetical protein